MSKQTYLKVFSILLIVLGVLTIVFSALSLTGGTMLGTLAQQPVPEASEDQAVQQVAVVMGAVALVLGIVMLVVGIFDLIAGIMGYRAAKGSDRCAKVAKVMGVISLLCTTAMGIYMIINNPNISTIASVLAGVGVSFCFVYGISEIQKESKTLSE